MVTLRPSPTVTDASLFAYDCPAYLAPAAPQSGISQFTNQYRNPTAARQHRSRAPRGAGDQSWRGHRQTRLSSADGRASAGGGAEPEERSDDQKLKSSVRRSPAAAR
ncbi:hypothetical protein JCM9533A_58240 [Catenuloplanes niger JCM 9533]